MSEHLSKAQVKWVRSLQQKKNRDAEGVFVAEGEKCVNDLRDAFELLLLASPQNASRMEIEQMSSLRNPQGTIAVFRKREETDIDTQQLLVALDGVQDPGNLGTIIRTCDWFGVHDIYCSMDTADCYNPKVVQATMGAIFRKRVIYTDLSAVCKRFESAGLPVYGTFLDGKNLYEGVPADRKHGLIVMGSESFGISDTLRELIGNKLLIPPYPADASTSESLNVAIATAIICAEFRR